MNVQEVSIADGEGGTLTVFEKTLSLRDRHEVEAIARMRCEADLLARLGGRVTPRLVDAGEDERGPWLRTEKVPFPTLATRLELAAFAGGDATLDAAWIERAVRAAFAALAELHEAADDAGPLHLVHADLSPANVAVDDAGERAVLLDFDLAAWRGAAPRDGAFRGTIAYAAPEIARGEAPTPQSDLFSLAAAFLHAVTGSPPRTGLVLAALLASAAEEPLLDRLPVAVETLAARGPAHAAILRCLAHVPRERPPSARHVLATL